MSIISPKEFISDQVKVVTENIIKHTIQLFKIPKDNYLKRRPIGFASGILLKIGNKFYVFTAGHVINDLADFIITIMIGDNYNPIGNITYIDPTKSEINDRYDVAYFEINNELVELISARFKFLDKSKVLFEHKTIDYRHYLIIGYPANSTKYKNFKIKSCVYSYLTKPLSEKVFQKTGLVKGENFLIEHRRRVGNLNNLKKQIRPIHHGLSGGGLWYIPKFLTNELKYYLIGILFEQDINLGACYATEISTIFKLFKFQNE